MFCALQNKLTTVHIWVQWPNVLRSSVNSEEGLGSACNSVWESVHLHYSIVIRALQHHSGRRGEEKPLRADVEKEKAIGEKAKRGKTIWRKENQKSLTFIHPMAFWSRAARTKKITSTPVWVSQQTQGPPALQNSWIQLLNSKSPRRKGLNFHFQLLMTNLFNFSGRTGKT